MSRSRERFQRAGIRQKKKRLSKDKEYELFAQMQAAERPVRGQLMNDLLEHYFYLVEQVVKSTVGLGASDAEDMFQEGVIGLQIAAKKFDLDRDVRFSTHARWWVRANIARAIQERYYKRPFRVTGCMSEDIRNINKFRREFKAHFGRWPTVEEVLDEKLANTNGKPFTREQIVERLANARVGGVSLDAPLKSSEGESDFLHEFISDDSQKSVDDSANHQEVIDIGRKLEEDLESYCAVALNARERMIFDLRIATSDARRVSLAEVGRELELSRERIRQIESKIYRALERQFHMNREQIELFYDAVDCGVLL